MTATTREGHRVLVLHPGDVACGERGDRFETLLGSCVAVILSDPRRTFGAICHIVHSGTPGHGQGTSGAYAATALARMHGLLRARGLSASLCDAWVFGGGNLFPALVKDRHVGDDNVRWVFDALRADGVRVVASEVGGHAYRRLAWSVGPDAPTVVTVPV